MIYFYDKVQKVQRKNFISDNFIIKDTFYNIILWYISWYSDSPPPNVTKKKFPKNAKCSERNEKKIIICKKKIA